MIEQPAVALRVHEDLVEVEAVRQSACGGCSVRGGCGSGALAELFGRRSSRIWLRNTVGARPGDGVVLGIGDGEFLSLSVAAYLVPVLGLLAGGVAGEWLGGVAGQATDVPAILGAAGGLAAGLLGSRVLRADSGGRPSVVLLRREPKAAATVTFS